MECITSANKATKPEGFIFDIGSLYSYLSRVSDSRKPKGVRYPLALILTLMVLAKLCGQDRPSGIAEWAQQRTEVLVQALHLKRKRMPHHSTYRRILEEVIDVEEFEKLVSQFLKKPARSGSQCGDRHGWENLTRNNSICHPAGLASPGGLFTS